MRQHDLFPAFTIFPIAKQLHATVASCAPTTSQLNIDIAELRGGTLSTRLQIFKVATQNVEGLTDSKEVELVVIMQACGIGVLCIQETHKKESCVRELCNGFLLILSGWDTNDINYAGVGFIIAPHVRRSIITYCLKSARICMLKLRTFKGKIAIFSAYAPPQTPKHSALERQAYFQELSKFWSDTSCNGPKLIAGDFNSRLYARLPGEEQIIGPNIIAKPGKKLHAHMNRFQLLQLCHDANLQIMNTFTQHELPDLVTYHEIWFDKNSPVTASNHELLDLLLVPQAQSHRLTNLHSVNNSALKSHHYMVIADFDVDLNKASKACPGTTIDRSQLRQEDTKQLFITHVEQEMSNSIANNCTHTVDTFSDAWTHAFQVATKHALSTPIVQKKQPWISDRTLRYIMERIDAKAEMRWNSVAEYNKLIKHSVKQDRATWFHDMLANGDWKAVQKFRKLKTTDHSKLRAADGRMMAVHERADGLAKHLETVQWAVRPDTIPSTKPALFDFASIPTETFTQEELHIALRALKRNRCSGDDNIPAEFWQVCLDSQQLSDYMLRFCNDIWMSAHVPKDWHRSRVACLFKKGDPACPDNYRPISLLQVCYRLFSSMILKRLKLAGVEEKLWHTQYGFRSGRGTKHAIFIARRLIEECHNSKDKSLVMLALDWAKAFDSIDPECLIQALHRFGLPSHYLQVIRNIYTGRVFKVSDHGHESQEHHQYFGISQGCPLSPFLFVMVMTILLHDANDFFIEPARHSTEQA